MLLYQPIVHEDARRLAKDLQPCCEKSDGADDMHRHHAEMGRERVGQPLHTVVRVAEHAALVIIGPE